MPLDPKEAEALREQLQQLPADQQQLALSIIRKFEQAGMIEKASHLYLQPEQEEPKQQ